MKMRLSLLALTMILVLAAAGLGSPPITRAEPDSTPEPPNAEDAARMDKIEAAVEEIRALEGDGVPRAMITYEQLYDQLVQMLADGDYTREDADQDAWFYAAFDLIPYGTLDLYQFQLDLLSEQIAGYYDTDEDRMYVLDIDEDGAFGAVEMMIYAHEYGHVLQDQHFDLESLGLDEDNEAVDSAMAALALIEGDAQNIMQTYLLEVAQDDPGLLLEIMESLDIEMAVMGSAPRIINDELMFPYLQGQAFVNALLKQGGWGLVDAAFKRPPLSTEQILHPDKYFDMEEPALVELEPALEALGEGWEAVEEETLGEAYLRMILDEHLKLSEASDAAAGWGGDRFGVFANREAGEVALVLRVMWDAPDEGEEFAAAYADYAAATLDVAEDADEGCWSNANAAICIMVAPDMGETLVVRAPDSETTRDLLAPYEGLVPYEAPAEIAED